MNIETANRLRGRREQGNLSPEALAEKIGVSGQTVSAWERAEAAPDADNLVALARLYGVSLDELLLTPCEAPPAPPAPPAGIQTGENGGDLTAGQHKALLRLPVPLFVAAAYLFLGFFRNLWHPGWLLFLAIPVYYQFVAMLAAHDMRKKLNRFPIALLCVLSYLLLGFFLNLWHPGWLLFLLIPAYHWLVNTAFRE